MSRDKIWKDIIGFEGLYQICNDGTVKSVERKVFHPITKIQIVNERILKPNIRRGYEYVTFSKDGKRKGYLVHRLVGVHFIEFIEGKKEINHKNGIKTDNRVENLEWVTSSENQLHAIKNNLQKVGVNHPNSKLTEKQVIEIRNSLKPYRVLAIENNVSKTAIQLIKKRITYNKI